MSRRGGNSVQTGIQRVGAALTLVTALTYSSHVAFGATQPTESKLTYAQAQKEFDRRCEPILRKQGAAVSQATLRGTIVQLQNYCAAAAAQKRAVQAQQSLQVVWGGVAAVCTSACVASFAGAFAKPWVCQGANISGAVLDAAMTANFQGALMGIASTIGARTLGGALAKSGASEAGADPDVGGDRVPANAQPGTQAQNGPGAKANAAKPDADKPAKASGKKKSKDIGACMLAATAGIQALTKGSSARAERDSFAANLATIVALDSARPGIGTAIGAPMQPQYEALAPKSRAVSSQSLSSADPCSGAGAASVLGCARAQDPSLPSFTGSREFAPQVRDASGATLDDWSRRLTQSQAQAGPASQPLGPMMARALGSEASAGQRSALAGVVNQLETRLPYYLAQAEGSWTTSGGTGGSSGSGGGGAAGGGRARAAAGGDSEDTDDLTGAVSAFLAQAQSQADGDAPTSETPGVAELSFGSARAPAATSAAGDGIGGAEQGLFERVGRCYGRWESRP